MRRTERIVILGGTLATLACADQSTNPIDPPPLDGAIAFASTRGARWQSPDIYVAHTDGSAISRVTLGTEPAWSWDGRRIAFLRDDNPYDRAGIYVAWSDGSNEHFVSPGWNPAWSPDGRLAFAVSGGIGVTDRGASRFDYRLLDRAWAEAHAEEGCGPGSWGPGIDHPTWSPDGTRIAFVLSCGDNAWSRVFVMDADGSEPSPLSESRGAGAPAWSPDGSMIAAWIDGAITTIDVRSRVHEVKYQPLDAAHGTKLDWSPDGRRIIFSAAATDKEQRVYVLTLETGQARQLIPDVWLSPDVMDYYEDFNAAWARVIQ